MRLGFSAMLLRVLVVGPGVCPVLVIGPKCYDRHRKCGIQNLEADISLRNVTLE